MTILLVVLAACSFACGADPQRPSVQLGPDESTVSVWYCKHSGAYVSATQPCIGSENDNRPKSIPDAIATLYPGKSVVKSVMIDDDARMTEYTVIIK